MEHCILGVTFWDGVLGIKYPKFCRIFKGVLHKTKIKQNTTKGLERTKKQNSLYF